MYPTTVHPGVGAMPETARLASAVSTSYFTATTTTTATVTQTVKEVLEIKLKERPTALATGAAVFRPTVTDYVEGLVGNITTPLQTLATKIFGGSAGAGDWVPVAQWLVTGGILGVGVGYLANQAFRKRIFKDMAQNQPVPAGQKPGSWKGRVLWVLYLLYKKTKKINELSDELRETNHQNAKLQEGIDKERLVRERLEMKIKKMKKNDGSAVTTPAAPVSDGSETLRRKTPTACPGLPVYTPLPAAASSRRPISSVREWMEEYVESSARKHVAGEMKLEDMKSGFWPGVKEYRRQQREKPKALGSEDDIQGQLLSEMGSSPPQLSAKGKGKQKAVVIDDQPEPMSLADELTSSQQREIGDYDYDVVMESIEEESEVSEGALPLQEQQRTTVETTTTAPPKLDLDKIPDLGPNKGQSKRGRPRKNAPSSPSPSPSRRTRSDRSPSKGVGSSQAGRVTRRSSRVGAHVPGSMSERQLARRSSSPRKGE